jgi:ACT domain-containing protein
MKRVILSIFLVLVLIASKAQNSAVDQLFDKYSGREGYTSILISKYMFSMFSDVNPDNKEFNDLVGKLNSIKILASDSANNSSGVNFYKEIMKELPVKDYKELMVVKEKDQEIKFLVKDVNGAIVELLLIVGGKSDNVLICIQGDNINLKNIAKLSKSMKIDGLENLEKIK